MQVDIWSDVVCPWCYIGKRRFESALAEFEGRDDVRVVWHSFELDPSAPRRREQPTIEYLASKYGMPLAQAQQMEDNVTSVASAEGLTYDLANTKSGNSFDAHRLIHFAAANGKQDEMKERLLAAYFTEGKAISDAATLVELAEQVGLDRDEAVAVLGSDAFAAEVRGDEGTAQQLGISGVPFFVFEQKYGVSGAQSSEVFARVLAQVADDAMAVASSPPTH